MILIDTSIWIELLKKSKRVRLSPEKLIEAATCPPVIQEVLQGAKNDMIHRQLEEIFLALPRVGDPIRLDTHLHAADLFRTGRRKGYTVRSSADCLIAAIALENGLPVWHRDRDYEALSRFTSLRTITRSSLQ